jgi:sugar fermentation stimulation protein A
VPLVGGAPIVAATFVARPNRFVIEAIVAAGASAGGGRTHRSAPTAGQRVLCHCADRGRLLWLQPGMPLLLGHKPQDGRKTSYQAAAAWLDGAWAALDTQLPNRLIERALRMGALSQFCGYESVAREARHGVSRFDFRLDRGYESWYVEVKSVGMTHNGVALFPDAPTERGRRHVEELGALAEGGTRAAIIFVAQHGAAEAVAVDRRIDPAFADAIDLARERGLEVYAFRCPIAPDGIRLEREIPYLDRA